MPYSRVADTEWSSYRRIARLISNKITHQSFASYVSQYVTVDDNCKWSAWSAWTRCPQQCDVSVSVVTVDDNCEWSAWSAWTRCPQQCDVSQRNRTRQCLTPPCTEDAVEIENCLRENCPRECKHSVHHSISQCFALQRSARLPCWILGAYF